MIETLSNPYGIATVFELSAEETKNIVPVARLDWYPFRGGGENARRGR